MESKRTKLSYREALGRNRRVWKLLWERDPGRFVSSAAYAVFMVAGSYVTIWLSARIINELAGGRDPGLLLRLVAAELVSAAALTLVREVLWRWYVDEWDLFDQYNNKTYADKLLDMDFMDQESTHTADLFSAIRQNEEWSSWGFHRSIQAFDNLVRGTLRILCGIGMSVSLFTAQVPNGSPFAFLNHPLCIIVIVGMMLAITALSSLCGTRRMSYWNRDISQTKFDRRRWLYYASLQKDRKRTADMRMYQQFDSVSSNYLSGEFFFSGSGRMGRYARGPMGLWAALSQSVSVILTGTVYLYVCLKAWSGAFGIGSVTQYIGVITNTFLGISAVLQALGNIRTNGEFLETNLSFLDVPNRMYQGSLTTEKRADRKYEVEFRDVSFRYPGSRDYALRHVSMKFRVGSRLAVVGMNGSGKTTFIKLLCRLYDPTEGQILLNGIDIRKYRYDEYIQLFSVVFQDFRLFALPLGQNVAGAADYDRDRVMDSLTKAGFADRAEAMPKGLDTYLYKDLDQEGIEISGGEAQKIAIARALYKDAPFIVLDEPTAALDPIAEAEIYSKFNDIAGDKTAIYISHRLSSCKFCDEIAVFHEGAVIQQGTHETLVADESGKYYELWHAQAQYYAKEAREERQSDPF